MKKLVLALALLMAVTAICAPTAQALPLCFKWVQFCDGIQVDSLGLGGGQWYHYDCANNSIMDTRKKRNGVWGDGCTPENPINMWIVRSLAPNGPGDYYFIGDLPFDGTLNMLQGTYPNGTCWIPDLQYDLQMGACSGVDDANNRSTIQ